MDKTKGHRLKLEQMLMVVERVPGDELLQQKNWYPVMTLQSRPNYSHSSFFFVITAKVRMKESPTHIQ